MTFAVEVTTDLFEPELPKGPYAIIDPDHAGSFKGATDRGQLDRKRVSSPPWRLN
jgi:hypothetical protein